MTDINYSLAAFPGKSYLLAMHMARANLYPDNAVPDIKIDHVQICPQNQGRFDESAADQLMKEFPETKFRLHANVFVANNRIITDLCDIKTHMYYWNKLAQMSQYINASGYSAHAGKRCLNTLQGVIDNAKKLSDLFALPVAIEGHYPERGDPWLFSTWEEYQFLLESGAPYALDLSHLNIVARNGRDYRRTLVQEMLSSEQCLEIHISGNDGRRDIHQPLDQLPYWWQDLSYAHPDAVIFSEGQHKNAI